VLLVTPNAGLNAAFSNCPSEPATVSAPPGGAASAGPQIHVFLAMLMLAEQYAAKKQCLQEK
jgi:hypothetical protein